MLHIARSGVRRAGVVAGLALLAAPLSRADELEKLLKRPLSAGSVALLIPHAAAPAAAERIAAALRSPDPTVRGAAARVANVAGATGLVAGVAEALRTEPIRSAST